MLQEVQSIQLPNGWICDGVLGQGSFGTVYRAKRVIGSNTEWAAVKHISVPQNEKALNALCEELGTRDPQTINDYLERDVQDILKEYYLMKELQGNTNIVACNDIQKIEKEGSPGYDIYIWMELLESLSSKIIKGEMHQKETIKMGMDICQALILLKSKDIIHRDIKPQNIFVNKNGDFKLGDFGSALGIEGTSALVSMEGTYSYLAPEIIQSKKTDLTSDIYSLGLVMYRLMNKNRHPFMQEGDVSSSSVIKESNNRRLSGEALPLPISADERLGQIILKACSFEPHNRWQSPEEFHEALAELNENTVKKKPPIDPDLNPPPPEEEQNDSIDDASKIEKKETSQTKRGFFEKIKTDKRVVIACFIIVCIVAVIIIVSVGSKPQEPPREEYADNGFYISKDEMRLIRRSFAQTLMNSEGNYEFVFNGENSDPTIEEFAPVVNMKAVPYETIKKAVPVLALFYAQDTDLQKTTSGKIEFKNEKSDVWTVTYEYDNLPASGIFIIDFGFLSDKPFQWECKTYHLCFYLNEKLAYETDITLTVSESVSTQERMA